MPSFFDEKHVARILQKIEDTPKNCLHCAFSRSHEGGLTCHRLPPQTHPMNPLVSHFPSVVETDWCGEYRMMGM